MAIFEFQFMQNAVWAALLASIACGVIGTYVVVKRLVFISGGIAHAAFGGIGLGYYLGINPLLGLIPFSLFSAFGIGWLSRKEHASEDTSIGVFWSVGMALGAVLISLTPGYAPELFSFLFGNILTVPRVDLCYMAGLDIFILVSVFGLYKELLALCFDEESAKVYGVKTNILYYFLLCLIAFTVVVLVRIVGIVLVIALLSIPAAIAKQYTTNLKKMMVISVILGMVFTLSGLYLSYVLDLASGASIILIAGLGFVCSSWLKSITR